jgi:hypothetical protein
MSFTHWLSNYLGLSPRPASRGNTLAVRPTLRPTLEALEDRWLPSTLTVSNNSDHDPGSLRAEIAASQLNDSIVFAPSLNGQTITLTSGELLITHSLTITGPGAGNLTVSGNHASRVFEVAQAKGYAANHANNVTLSGLTISNGMVSGYGGGIANYGTLTVSSCTLSGNSATYGGGIFNNGTLTVSSCTLSGNTATKNGGGIANVNTLTVSSSTLIDNHASQGNGGGIGNFSGTATVSGSTLSNNSAGSSGGGIFNGNYGTLTLSSSILSSNTPDNIFGNYKDGGGNTIT